MDLTKFVTIVIDGVVFKWNGYGVKCEEYMSGYERAGKRFRGTKSMTHFRRSMKNHKKPENLSLFKNLNNLLRITQNELLYSSIWAIYYYLLHEIILDVLINNLNIING